MNSLDPTARPKLDIRRYEVRASVTSSCNRFLSRDGKIEGGKATITQRFLDSHGYQGLIFNDQRVHDGVLAIGSGSARSGLRECSHGKEAGVFTPASVA